MHVLSTLIKDDGKRISTHYIAKNVSEPARKEMEKQYGFVPADKKVQQREEEKQLAVTPQKIQAGKSATMRSITNVLDHVIDRYKYTLLYELNAVLKLYNVKADRGAEDGRIYKHRGLTYVVVDQDGKALTKPVKASVFQSKPILVYIEAKFKENEEKRQPDKKRIKTAVDWAMQSRPGTLGELAKLLQKERIDLVIRRNDQGRGYGMTYVDHERKSVFNGSDIGKEYSAKKILERLGMLQQPQPEKEQVKTKDAAQRKSVEGQQQAGSDKDKLLPKDQDKARADEKEKMPGEELGKEAGKLIEEVVGPDYGNDTINKDLLTEEQRKKKERL